MHDERMFIQLPLDKKPVAMAYVPWQGWEDLFDLSKGFRIGTIFPSLNKPFMENSFCKGGCPR